MPQVEYAISEAKRQLGGNWRLPTRQELESLVCEECTAPKINSKYFPKISPEAYWTSDKNTLNPKTFWSVNFMTGHSYSRFFPYQSSASSAGVSRLITPFDCFYVRLNKVKIITNAQTTAADISITCDLAFLTFAKYEDSNFFYTIIIYLSCNLIRIYHV